MENNSIKQSSNEPSVNSYIGKVVLDKAILAVILGAVGYILGWRFLSAYYSSFGIDETLFSFSPTFIVSAGWRIYILVTVLVSIFAAILVITRKITDFILLRRGGRLLTVLFFVSLLAGIVLLLFSLNSLWARGTYLFKEFFFLATASLLLFWIAFIFAQSIQRLIHEKRSRLSTSLIFFSLFYPSPLIWSAGLFVHFIFLIMFLSTYNGIIYARGDKGPNSSLPLAQFYSDRKLSIPFGNQVSQDVWYYNDLRYLYKTDEVYFFLRLTEVQNNAPTLYAIPKERIIEYRFQPWFHPGENP